MRVVSLEHAVMGLLAGGERYGYDIRRVLEAELGPEWRVDFGQLYRVLARLKRKGWVLLRVAASEQGPERKMYRLSTGGRRELQAWLARPAATREIGRDELAVKLRFGLDRRPAMLARVIGERRHMLEADRNIHQRARDSRHGREAGRWLLAHARVRHAEAALEWLQSCAAVLPQSDADSRAPEAASALVALGSDDPVLEMLMRRIAERCPDLQVSARPTGSLPGLIALRERRAHFAGVHLLDVDSGEYNVPFVKHVLPEEPMLLMHLAQREQGLMIAAGDPKNIRRLRDLARRGVRLINRQRGAGTRLLLHYQLRKAHIDPHDILGYDREAPTHNAVAAAIAAGTADAGPGIRAVAAAWGLEFIPLGREQYDLAIPRAVFDSPQLRPLFEMMHDDSFRRAAAAFSGYDLSRMSQIVAELH